VVEWDEKIGGGRPGSVTKKLLEMWNGDTKSLADQLVAVPYDEGV
jgi:hypothetical protein